MHRDSQTQFNNSFVFKRTKTHIRITDRDKEGLYSIHINSQTQQNHYFLFKKVA